MKVDLNSDLGESFGRYKLGLDDEVMKYITSANVACGWHAGDPLVMRKTVRLAKKNNVQVGAHPGYPDLMGFGRRYMKLTPEEARNYILYQIGALYAFVKAEGLELQHVKPHGALYNAMVKEEDLARAVIEGILDFDKRLIVVTLAGSRVVEIAREMGARVAQEGFADRAYNPDGTLVPRSRPGAVIEDKEEIAERVISMVKDGGIRAINGEWIELEVDTICVHGDNPKAVEITAYIRRRLEEEGVKVLPMGDFIK
ncbi:LamB/YcsF family protein [Pyrococcus furiosus DSM 3638]|uniref:5-oxoprolinase subunit A n=3 Tax=Pyrococcus furiosus TaxID=2261 RepID=PXPA_PYRFU|nr:5-oxoprolinase subunit PxpA [Pyrococcus furiosus]Q8U1D7.1 RecName: Full=5-oxoprolinase subunit A; Short=5-OPase subunit A; AltName: Full=5-oxoprolinase (ATP-hydrolyzing) subunit A [Pyrococcus furiosus DSM 3638]AAL81396.1 lactam utilization protein homolog [Pyrococcus furiosus DSM 3638]AFN04056.1 LamB/YcsF family protein [Pyrococcus furiosus COM1]QEK78914.1 LamB/YcsF family protein [Pyrococcus furiosus DSM 3638]